MLKHASKSGAVCAEDDIDTRIGGGARAAAEESSQWADFNPPWSVDMGKEGKKTTFASISNGKKHPN